MNILLLGSGGREHAIAWKIAQSPKVDKLFIAPGNAGTALVGTNVDIKADDFAAIKDFSHCIHFNSILQFWKLPHKFVKSYTRSGNPRFLSAADQKFPETF